MYVCMKVERPKKKSKKKIPMMKEGTSIKKKNVLFGGMEI